jgi:hypothetical protein
MVPLFAFNAPLLPLPVEAPYDLDARKIPSAQLPMNARAMTDLSRALRAALAGCPIHVASRSMTAASKERRT